jgi:hypothetical protein
MSEIIKEYLGREITYDEQRNLWTCLVDGDVLTARSLSKLKEMVGNRLTELERFPRIAPIRCYRRNQGIVMVNSIARIEDGEYYFRVKGGGVERGKVLFPVTEENERRVQEIIIALNWIARWRARIEEFEKRMVSLEKGVPV